jgi:hypothetical protein
VFQVWNMAEEIYADEEGEDMSLDDADKDALGDDELE